MEKRSVYDDSSDSDYDEEVMLALSDSDIDEVERQLSNAKLNNESEEYR